MQITFKYFEAESWRDYFIIPLSFLKFIYSYLFFRIVQWWDIHIKKHHINGIHFGWGRREDPTPIWCPRCCWAGMRKWLVHSYQDDGTGLDIISYDECPRCGIEL